MAPVTLRSVKKSYGAFATIHGVDIDVADGEFVVLVGPSGCGKSTLLRMIAGLETVTSGDISISSRVVNEIEPKDRDIAMVFQNYALYPHMSVAKNMAFSLEHRGGSKAEIAERVSWAAEILGLTPLLERFPRQLSGGQRQRVAIGRAIVRNPRVFLFDEPLSNLDAALRVATRIEIAKLKQSMPDVTMIYVTHDQVEAMTLADRIVVFKDGDIEQVGTPTDLYRKPANLFVAQFIGSPAMNILKGTVVEWTGTSARCRLECGVTLELAVEPGRLSKDEAVSVGIRPENTRLVGNVENDPTFTGTINLIEHLGEVQILYLDLPGTREKFLLKVDGESAFSRLQTVSFTARGQDIHVFDAAGKAVSCKVAHA